MTRICKIYPGGKIIEIGAFVGIDPKPALVAHIMQTIHHNFNTWEYPEVVTGMYPGIVSSNWYYDTQDGGTLAAYGEGLAYAGN